MKLLRISLLGIAVALVSCAIFALAHSYAPAINRKVKLVNEPSKVFSNSRTRTATRISSSSPSPASTTTSTPTSLIDPIPTATERSAPKNCLGCEVASAVPHQEQGPDPTQGQTFEPSDDISLFDAPSAAGGITSGADFSLGEAAEPDDTSDDLFNPLRADPMTDYFGLPASVTATIGKLAVVNTRMGGFHASPNSPVTDFNRTPVVAVSAPVPEPKTYTLILGGCCALGVMVRRRQLN